MARATQRTLLPLDQWAAILGISPWEFNGFEYPAPKSAQCQAVFYQFAWQADHLNREEVAEAIAQAEEMIAAQLRYYPAPKYIVDEVISYPRPHQRDQFGFAGTPRGEWKTVQTEWHQVISGGVFNRTPIGTISGGALVAKDEDSDGVFETFEATLTDPAIATLIDPYELALYFVAADRHGEGLDESWRLRPLTISIAGNTATFRGHRTLLANPEKAYGVTQNPLNPTISGNYVTSLDCYRVFTDTSSTDALPYQGVAIWKNDPSCQQDCTFSLIPLCLGQHQNRQGTVFASFGDPCTWPFRREPDRLQVNYVSGLPLVNGQMEANMARAVAYLSCGLLAHEKCGCERSNRILERWQRPVLRFEDTTAKAQAFAPSDNPFPMTAGGMYAWKFVRDKRNVEIVSL